MRKRILAAAVTAATLASGAQAAGFYLKELSITGQGRAFAGEVTNTEDAAAVYFNPAATAGMTDSKNLTVGAHAIAPDSKLTNTGTLFSNGVNTNVETAGAETKNPYGTSLIPNIYATMPLENGSVLGFGVNNPFGLANQYEKDSFVRYDSTETELKTPSFNFSLAKQLNDKLSFGFGIEAQKGEAILESASAISLPSTPFTILGDINSRLEAETGFELAPFLGITYRASEETQLGFSYRSGIDHEAEGEIILTPNTSSAGDSAAFQATVTSLFSGAGLSGTALSNAVAATVAAGSYTVQNATAELSTPSIASFGVKHAISDSTRVYADATFYEWSAFDEIVITTSTVSRQVQGYKDTMSYALGAEHTYSDQLTMRAGVMFDPTPTVDEYRSARTPDADRTWLAIGGTYSIEENMDFDFAFTHILLDETILEQDKALTLGGSPLGTAQIRADGEGSVNILSLGLRYKF